MAALNHFKLHRIVTRRNSACKVPNRVICTTRVRIPVYDNVNIADSCVSTVVVVSAVYAIITIAAQDTLH